MIDVHNVADFAASLRLRGLEARSALRDGPDGVQAGLEIAGCFYPLWELNAPENQVEVSELNFDAIRARRQIRLDRGAGV
jgi:hypothetical protein